MIGRIILGALLPVALIFGPLLVLGKWGEAAAYTLFAVIFVVAVIAALRH